MKRKFFSVMFALVLVLSMSMVMAPPALAATAVTEVWVEFDDTADRNTVSDSGNEYIIHFNPATALARGVDWVTVTFPDGSTAMGGIGSTYAFGISGAVAATNLEFSTNYGTKAIGSATFKRSTSAATTGGYRVKVLVPFNYAAGTDVWLKISSSSITSASAVGDNYKVKVSTTKDTTAVLSSAFSLGADSTVVANVTTTVAPATAGATGQYTISFDVDTELAASSGKVTIRFPVGTVLPSSMTASDVEVKKNGGSFTATGVTPIVDTDRRLVTIITPVVLTDSGDVIHDIKFLAAAGITNPTIADTSGSDYYVGIRTSGDREWVRSSVHSITAGAATKLVIANGEIGRAASLYSDDATMINTYSSQIYVMLADANGNGVTPASGVTVTPSSGTGSFYKPGAVDADAGTMTQVTSITVNNYDPHSDTDQIVTYKNSTAGTHTLTFTASGYTSVTWTVTVAPAVSLYDANGDLVNTYAPTSTSPASETSDEYAGTAYKYGVDYINDAITGAMAGDTVKLGDGTYELDATISLNKKITLTSVNGASSTTLRNVATTFDKGITVGTSGTATNPIIIDGFTFQRLRSGKTFERAVYSDGYDYVTVRNNTFNYIEPDVQFDASTPGAVVFIGTRNVNADITSATVSNNTFNNSVTTWPDLGSGAKAAVIGFQTFNATYTLVGGTISGNTINNSYGIGIGINGYNSDGYITASVTDNTITNGYSSIQVEQYSKNVKVTGNTITGAYSYGIKVSGNIATSLVIKNNTITNTVGDGNGAGIRIQTVTAVSPIVQYNDITGSNTYAIKVDSGVGATTVDSKYNYYGDATGPSYTALTGAQVSKSNPNGTGDKITDRVTYYPWLHKSLADVVADNASYQASTIKLGTGWNTLSTPVKLIAAADSIDELIPSGMTIGYYYDGGWQLITTGYVLNAVDAVYVKMSAVTYVLLKFDAGAFTMPSKDLVAGWNLASLASLSSMTEIAGVASVLKDSANLPGYSQVISPSMNANQTDMLGASGESWAYSAGQSTAKSMLPGLGYWIYMQNAATLAGFEITPIAPDLD